MLIGGSMKKELRLSKNEKILLTLFKLSDSKAVRYEEIVVALFKKYPEDFHLKGHPEYPDSGDLIHKPLYEFRKKGLVDAGNKMFALTDLGLEIAQKIDNVTKGRVVKKSSQRLPHFIERELDRLSRMESLKFFVGNRKEKILDTDFYDYLDITVRSSRNDFLGKLRRMDDIVNELKNTDNEKYGHFVDFHKFMKDHFKDIINYFTTH